MNESGLLARILLQCVIAPVLGVMAANSDSEAQESATRKFEVQGTATVGNPLVGPERELSGSLSNITTLQVDGSVSVEQANALLAGAKLESIRFHDKAITDEHLRGWVGQPHLSAIDLHATSVTGRFLAFRRKSGETSVSPLRSLDLGETEVADEDLAHLKACPLLRSLKLRKTGVTDECVKYLETLDFLEELDLGETKITLDGVARLAKIRTLRILWIPVDLPADEVARRISGLSLLEELHGSERFSDKGLRFLGRLPNLKSLGVWDSPNLTGKGLEYLAALSCLANLELVRCGIQDSDLTHLKSLPSLRILYMVDCEHLTDDALLHVGALTHLQSLTLEEMSITDRGTSLLKNLVNLEVLSLRSTPIGDAAMGSIAGLENLRMLYLEGTDVKSAGLRSLSRLRRLRWLGADALENDARLRAELQKSLKYVVPQQLYWMP